MRPGAMRCGGCAKYVPKFGGPGPCRSTIGSRTGSLSAWWVFSDAYLPDGTGPYRGTLVLNKGTSGWAFTVAASSQAIFSPRSAALTRTFGSPR